MENDKPKKLLTPFTIINIIFFLAIIINSFYFFYIKKDYNFIIETECDSQNETCFVRDCSNPDVCPPNGLSTFKRYSLNANDFKYCKDENCTDFCRNNTVNCSIVVCTEDPEVGESCSNKNI